MCVLCVFSALILTVHPLLAPQIEGGLPELSHIQRAELMPVADLNKSVIYRKAYSKHSYEHISSSCIKYSNNLGLVDEELDEQVTVHYCNSSDGELQVVVLGPEEKLSEVDSAFGATFKDWQKSYLDAGVTALFSTVEVQPFRNALAALRKVSLRFCSIMCSHE
jgi:hypothetical protein